MTDPERSPSPSFIDRAHQGLKAVKDAIEETAQDVLEALDGLLAPPPEPVPIRTRPLRRPPRRR